MDNRDYFGSKFIPNSWDSVTHPTTPYDNRADEEERRRQQYEEDLRERKRRHLEKVAKNGRNRELPFRPCLHDGCNSCCGTGVREDGSACIHMISCPCPKCTPYCMAVNPNDKSVSL